MKKLNLGVATTPKSTKANHASASLDATAAALLTQWVGINPQYKTLKNQVETLAKQLAPMIRATYFSRFAGVTPESSTMLVDCDGVAVKLIVKNAYSKLLLSEAGIVGAIGQELCNANFRQATVLKVDFDKVPDASQEEFAQAVLKLAAQMGATDAVSVSQCIQPKAGFHESRTTLLTPEQNEALDRVLPVTAYPLLS
jgi:hypothetical protein